MSGSKFARTLKSVRLSAGLTQAQLAVAVGIDVTTVARLERGENEPSRRILDALHARFPDVPEFQFRRVA